MDGTCTPWPKSMENNCCSGWCSRYLAFVVDTLRDLEPCKGSSQELYCRFYNLVVLFVAVLILRAVTVLVSMRVPSLWETVF